MTSKYEKRYRCSKCGEKLRSCDVFDTRWLSEDSLPTKSFYHVLNVSNSISKNVRACGPVVEDKD